MGSVRRHRASASGAGVLFNVPPVADAAADVVEDERWLLLGEPVATELLPPDEAGPSPLSPADLLCWAEAEPSFGLAASLVDGVDPLGLDELEQVRLLELAGRLENQAAALRLRAVAAVAGPEPMDDKARRLDFADCEVAAALNLSPRAGARQVHAARQLHAHLPATVTALGRGVLSGWQALSMAEATYDMDPALLPRVEQLALTPGAMHSPGRLRAAVRKAVARVAPAALADKERAARQAAQVTVIHGEDGTAELWAERIPAADAAVIEAAVDGYARSRKAQGDEQTLGQLRVAALAVMCSRYLTGPDAPTSHGRPITVQVSMDLPTFLGLSDQPAEVTGGGIIPAQVARELVGDARLRRLIIDPASGHLLDYGRKTYRVPADLAEAIAARYVTTTGPGSTTPARAGDQDHDQPWNQGGTTDRDNLHPPGRRHHNSKTRGGWTTRICDCGTVIWRTAKGATYRVEPHDYRLGP